MDLRIAGLRAIVCASSKGLGRACALALAQEGCEVVVNGRDPEQLSQTAENLRLLSGAAIQAVEGDLDDPRTRDRLLAACAEPDILVNNNGGPPFKAFPAITREDVLNGVESNMLTPIALIQAVLPGMVSRKFGRIINITSSSVRAPIPGLDVSSGARAGLTAFVAAVARAHVRDNVTINSIQPGSFDTDRSKASIQRTAAQRGISIEAARAEAEKRSPAARFGDPAELGALCAFLASAHAGFITGQNFLIDGGAFPGTF